MYSSLVDGFGIAGYRSYGRDVQTFAPLQQINYIVGQNNAGKSNVLRFMKDFFQSAPPQVGGEDLFTHSAESQPIRLEMAVPRPEDPVRMLIRGRLFPDTAAQFPEASAFCNNLLASLPSRHPVTGCVWLPLILESHPSSRSTWKLDDGLVAEVVNANPGDTVGGVYRRWGNDLSEAQFLASAYHYMLRYDMHFKRVEVIRAFRHISPAKTPHISDLYSGVGVVGKLLEWLAPKEGVYFANKRKLERVNECLRFVLDDPTLALSPESPPTEDPRNLLVEQGGAVKQLASLGTGIEQLVIIATACIDAEPSIIGVEEPELHLHPVLQRRLLSFLQENTSNQYLIATHSAHILDHDSATIFHVRRNSSLATYVEAAGDMSAVSGICADLGYRASDIAQSNIIIWVEGPSDRYYVEHWLRQCDPVLRRGLHYSIMFYGGSIAKHLSSRDPDEMPIESADDLISLRQINRRMIVVIDSDKTSTGKKLSGPKQRLINELGKLESGGNAWVTWGYTIENYIPLDHLSIVARMVHPRTPYEWDGSRYSNPLGALGKSVQKTRISQEVCRRWEGWGDAATGLENAIRRLAAKIREANDMELPSELKVRSVDLPPGSQGQGLVRQVSGLEGSELRIG
jgi:hypothetical protein